MFEEKISTVFHTCNLNFSENFFAFSVDNCSSLHLKIHHPFKLDGLFSLQEELICCYRFKNRVYTQAAFALQ